MENGGYPDEAVVAERNFFFNQGFYFGSLAVATVFVLVGFLAVALKVIRVEVLF